MSLSLQGYIDLPAHRRAGGFDHAAVHGGLRHLYVAHTANDTLDIIDLDAGRCIDSIGGLTGVAERWSTRTRTASSRRIGARTRSGSSTPGTRVRCSRCRSGIAPTGSMSAQQEGVDAMAVEVEPDRMCPWLGDHDLEPLEPIDIDSRTLRYVGATWCGRATPVLAAREHESVERMFWSGQECLSP